MRPTLVLAIAFLIVVAALSGCMQVTIAPPSAAMAPAAPTPAAEPAAPAVVSAAPAVVVAASAVETATPAVVAVAPPVAAPVVALAPAAVSPPPAGVPPLAAVVATAPAPKAVSPAPPKVVAAPPVKAAAPLDLTSLETRLRATAAIGAFTKLSLKNQVGDLIDEFKGFHHGGTPALPSLRQKYDLLLLKVLSLLQDNDASLATAISASRESIWGILVDPAKFAKLG